MRLGVSKLYIYGAFQAWNGLNTINVKKRSFYLNEKKALLPAGLKNLNFVDYDSGLRKYSYDIEQNALFYVYRDTDNKLYLCKMDIHEGRKWLSHKIITQNHTNGVLKYLYSFHQDTMYYHWNNDVKYKGGTFIQEGYKLISTNSYPVFFNRDDFQFELLLCPNFQLKFKYFNDNLIDASPLSAYSDFENLYILVRDYYSVSILKYTYKINILRVKRNHIFAKHGREFKSKDLQDIFNAQDWYKVNPNYSNDLLSDKDKREIKRLYDLEKKYIK